MRFRWGDELSQFGVWRNGRAHDWDDHATFVYREAGRGPEGLVHQRWGTQGGTLQVNTGSHRFSCMVGQDNRVTFSNE